VQKTSVSPSAGARTGGTPRPGGVAAGVLLLIAGTGTLRGIITAEALYPVAFDPRVNTVSDLGAMRPENVGDLPGSPPTVLPVRDGLDRRAVLKAGGLLTLGGVLAACTGQRPLVAQPDRKTSPAPPTTASTTTAAPTPSAVGLLDRAGTCTLTPETIAGPTWFDAAAVRGDIREGRPGVPLDLAFRVERAGTCAPIPHAVVDLWQCDALGVYSGFAGAEPGQGGDAGGRDRYGDTESRATDADRWLRGTQVTDAGGVVTFSSIYPGWYPTRTAHLHLKVHLDGSTALTTQLFFDDAVSDAVYAAHDPYRRHAGRDTRNGRDEFYTPAARLHLARSTAGWLGAIVLAVR
jgi:protocatechuate 3,4-dioxygenase beta subunit